MMTKDEALKMAIAEIEGWIDHAYGHSPEECADNKAIKACKEALEQQKQEPVAWLKDIDNAPIQIHDFADPDEEGAYPVYIHPAKQMVQMMPDGTVKPVFTSLSDDEINECWYQSQNDVEGVTTGHTTQWHYFARLLEAKIRGE